MQKEVRRTLRMPAEVAAKDRHRPRPQLRAAGLLTNPQQALRRPAPAGRRRKVARLGV